MYVCIVPNVSVLCPGGLGNAIHLTGIELNYVSCLRVIVILILFDGHVPYYRSSMYIYIVYQLGTAAVVIVKEYVNRPMLSKC
jgi:hypothetical protein